VKKLTRIKERILQYIDSQNIVREEFYKKVSIDGANFRGKNLNSEFSADKIVRILRIYPNISVEWLLLGEGEMLKSNIKLKENEDEKVSKLLNIIEKQQDTINNQQEIINNLVNKQEKTSAQQDNDAECATA
jgi:hypothetical protein